MGFMARGSQEGRSGASTSRFKRRKTTGDGGPGLAWVEKQVATMKKKLGELCILNSTDGFLICDSPALGLQAHWPEDRESCLALVRKFRDCQECGNQKAKHEGVSVLLKNKVTRYKSYLKVFQEHDQESRLARLLRLVCGEVGLDGLGLGDLEKVMGRIDSELGGVRKVIELLQKRSNLHPESSIELKETGSCVLDFEEIIYSSSAPIEPESGDILDYEEIINSSSAPSAITADVVHADCHGCGFDQGLENTAELEKGCLRESACESMDVGFLEDGDFVQDFEADDQNEGEIAVQTEMAYLNTSFCDDIPKIGYVEIGDLMGDFEEGVHDQAMTLGREEEALIDSLCDCSDVGFLQMNDLDDKAEDQKEPSEEIEEDSLTDNICTNYMDLGLFYTEEDFSSEWSGTELTHYQRHDPSPLTFWA